MLLGCSMSKLVGPWGQTPQSTSNNIVNVTVHMHTIVPVGWSSHPGVSGLGSKEVGAHGGTTDQETEIKRRKKNAQTHIWVNGD